MLTPSTPAAPRLARTLAQATRSVAGAYTLSIRLYQRPPLTPFSSADIMRSVHTEASTQDQSRDRPPVSAPRLAPRGTAAAFSCFAMGVMHPPSCPPFPRPGFAPRASRDWRRCGTMRALTPAGLARERQVSPLTPLRLPDIPPPTTLCRPVVAFAATSARPAGPLPGLGFAVGPQARHGISPNRVRSPTGCPFASGCSPPHLAATQLPSASCTVASHGKDSHLADEASSRTHGPRHKAEDDDVCW